MAASLIQTATNNTAGAVSLAIGSGQGWVTPAAGNLIVAWSSSDATNTGPAGFSPGPSVVDANAGYIWFAIAAGTESSLSIGIGAASSPTVFGLMEYSGVSATPTDVQSFWAGPTFTPASSTTATSVTGTGTIGDLFIAVACLGGPGTAFPSAPAWTNSFVNRQTVNGGTVNTSVAQTGFSADFQNTAPATVSTAASWTGTAAQRQELLIGFKLAAAAGPPPPTVGKAKNVRGPRHHLPGRKRTTKPSSIDIIQQPATPPPYIGWGWGTRN